MTTSCMRLGSAAIEIPAVSVQVTCGNNSWSATTVLVIQLQRVHCIMCRTCLHTTGVTSFAQRPFTFRRLPAHQPAPTSISFRQILRGSRARRKSSTSASFSICPGGSRDRFVCDPLLGSSADSGKVPERRSPSYSRTAFVTVLLKDAAIPKEMCQAARPRRCGKLLRIVLYRPKELYIMLRSIGNE